VRKSDKNLIITNALSTNHFRGAHGLWCDFQNAIIGIRYVMLRFPRPALQNSSEVYRSYFLIFQTE
jgi:hypothetical protein